MNHDRASDGDLLARDDAPAFAAFYRRHEDAVLGFFRRRTGSPELAADLAAETFARALAGKGRFDPARGEASAWLFGIAHHLMAASVRRGRVEDDVRRRLGMEPLVLDDTDVERIDELAGRPAEQALARLPVDQRTAVKGRIVDDSSYTDLAAQMRCSESVVRQRVSRGLRSLRAVLEE